MRATIALLLLAAAIATPLPANITENVSSNFSDDTLSSLEESSDAIKGNNTFIIGNNTYIVGNDTVIELDGEHEPIVRKKRTFGDVVFRGLADVLGYNVQRKPAQDAFPPPLQPVPGIDAPLQAGPAPPPPPRCAAPPPAPPPPCRAAPPPPPPPPPCPRPRPRPKPCPPPPPPCPPPPPPPCGKRPPPPPPPPPPCGKPLPPPPPPPCARPAPKTNPCAPPPKDNADDTVSTNFQLSFNINRNRPTQAPAPAPAWQEQAVPIAIEPRAARLPPPQQRNLRRQSVDSDELLPQQQDDDDYIADDEEDQPVSQPDDDYEDVEDSRDDATRQVGTAVDQFWSKKGKKVELPTAHYKNVHFGDKNLVKPSKKRGKTHQSLQRNRPRAFRVLADTDEDQESTTTTEDPRTPLKPRVLPPTEHNPGQIDTVTVRVPPIYKEKRPKKYHRGRPDRDDTDNDVPEFNSSDELDSDGENSALTVQTEPPRRTKKSRKLSRRTRSTDKKPQANSKENSEEDEDDNPYDLYDYYGKKLPASDEEKQFMKLLDKGSEEEVKIARIEEEPYGKGYFLDDHERLTDDPERVEDPEREADDERADDFEKSDDSGRADESERSVKDTERTDKLSPNARVRETGFQNNYVRATNTRVIDPRPVHLRHTKTKRS